MSAFLEALQSTGLPEAALKPLIDKYNEAFNLTVENNKRVAQINAAKAQDPNNTEYLDSLWRANFKSDPEMVEVEEQYQIVTAEYEKLLAQLREFGKKHVPVALSEDEAKNTRKLVNESAPTIQTARDGFAAMAEMVNAVLSAQGKSIEGGLLSFLPEVESLKNARGRKAATAGGNIGVYMTRVHDVLIDGESTRTEKGGKFNYAADKLSAKFGVSVYPGNQVTAEEVEKAYYDAMGIELRDKSKELPLEFTFDFTKVTKKPNPNDGEMVEAPVTVRLTVQSEKYGKQQETASDKPSEDKATASEKADEKTGPGNEKVEAKTSPAPAKKTTAPAKK